MDHNALQGQLGKIYSGRVAGVIDHHDDEHKVPEDTGSEPRVIIKTGSCTSLVTEYCRPSWDSLSNAGMSSGAAHAQGDSLANDAAVTKLWDAQVAQLGLASILIDTSNLENEDKTTEHDKKAVTYLEAKIHSCPRLAGFDRTKFYEQIDAAKKDIGGLKLQDVLRKDYKQWDEGSEKLGVSSVVKPIDFLQKKAAKEIDGVSQEEAFSDALQSFAKERDLGLYAVMTTSTSSSGDFQRELLLWAFNEAATASAKDFESQSKKELGLEDWKGSNGQDYGKDGKAEWRKVWWQREVQHSRKRVAPLLREAMT